MVGFGRIWVYVVLLCWCLLDSCNAYVQHSGFAATLFPHTPSTNHFNDTIGPGSRTFAGSWTDASGNYWLFGGYMFSGITNCPEHLNDLWKYDILNLQWTFVNTTTKPSARTAPITWQYTQGPNTYLYLYGGTSNFQNKESSTPDLSDMWMFSITTSTWQKVNETNKFIQAGVGGYPGARMGSAAWMSGSDLVLFGGRGASNELWADMWKFNTIQNAWVYATNPNTGNTASNKPKQANTPACLMFASVVVVETLVYLLGGSGMNDTVHQASGLTNTWIFNGESWTARQALALGYSMGTAWSADGGIYTFGGKTADNTMSNQLWFWDLGTDGVFNYTTNDPAQAPRKSYGFSGWSSVIYGGFDTSFNILAQLWVHIPASTVWSARYNNPYYQPPTYSQLKAPIQRYGASTWTVGNQMWMFGGCTDALKCSGVLPVLNDMWVFDTKALTWRLAMQPTRANHPDRPSGRLVASSWLLDGRLFLFGGLDASSVTNCELWEYKLDTNTWYLRNNCSYSPSARWGATTWVTSTDLFLFGGCNDSIHSNCSAEVWQYDLLVYQWAHISVGSSDQPVGGISYAFLYLHYVYIQGGSNSTAFNNDLWQFDLANPSAPWELYAITGDWPGVSMYPISWQDPSGTPYLAGGSDNVIWSLETTPTDWTSMASPSLPPNSFCGVSQADFVYVFGGLQGTSTNSVVRLDPCDLSNGGCAEICVHSSPATCMLAVFAVPLLEFNFEATIAPKNSWPGVLTASPGASYTTGKCGYGLRLDGNFASLAASAWSSVDNDFTIAFWAKFTTPDDTPYNVELIGQQGCDLQNKWGIGYYPETNELYFYYTTSSEQQTININGLTKDKFVFYTHIALTRSGSKFCLYYNNTLADCVNSMYRVNYRETLIGKSTCLGTVAPATLSIDNLMLYDIAIEPQYFYAHCDETPGNIVAVSACQSLATPHVIYRLTTDLQATLGPCLQIQSSAMNITIDGNYYAITCNPGDCIGVSGSETTNVTIINLTTNDARLVFAKVNYLVIANNRIENSMTNPCTVVTESNFISFTSNTFDGCNLAVSVDTATKQSFVSNRFYSCMDSISLQFSTGNIDVIDNIFDQVQTTALYADVSGSSVMNVANNQVVNSVLTVGFYVHKIGTGDPQCIFTSNYVGNVTAKTLALNIFQIWNMGPSSMFNTTVTGVHFKCNFMHVNIDNTYFGIEQSKFIGATNVGSLCSDSRVIGIFASKIQVTVKSTVIDTLIAPPVFVNPESTGWCYTAGIALEDITATLLFSRIVNVKGSNGVECSNCNITSGYAAYGVLTSGTFNTLTIQEITVGYLVGGNAAPIISFVSNGQPRLSNGGDAIAIDASRGFNLFSLNYTDTNNIFGGHGVTPQSGFSNEVSCTGGEAWHAKFNNHSTVTITGQFTHSLEQNGTDCNTPCGVCGAHASCNYGTSTCECDALYVGNGTHCVYTICEPECGINSECTYSSQADAYVCTCLAGYVYSNGECKMVGCSTNNCSAHAACADVPGGFTCACRSGYDGNGYVCNDIDECFQNTYTCPPDTICMNTNGSYNCTRCPQGYQASGRTCVDYDECEANNFTCPPGRYCVNTIGSYNCSFCSSGYHPDSTQLLCIDIDECIENTFICNATQVCVNSVGSYDCVDCSKGYKRGPTNQCIDIDECEAGTFNCSSTDICVNDPGTYHCTGCQTGYQPRPDHKKCIDINECALNKYNCTSTEFCVNKPGSYICSPCQAGYQQSPDNKCIDTNECLTLNGGCDNHVTCKNTEGSFICPPCPPQFYGDSYDKCHKLCGDKICNPLINETCVTCPQDCNATTCSACGDGKCDIGESCTSCPEDCKHTCVQKQCTVPDCSGHGTCVDGTCVCTGTWTGPSCATTNVVVNVTSNSSNPVVTITPPQTTAFMVSIKAIKEITAAGEIVVSYDLKGNFSKVTSSDKNSSVYIFANTFENGASVSIAMQLFTVDSKVVFANQTTTYPANTIKITVNITTWPFKSMTNSLGVVLDAASQQQETKKCNIKAGSDSTGSLSWYVLTFNNALMYGQFAPAAIVDGRNRNITFSLADDATVTATVPHFWDHAFLDPSYSVLIDEDPKDPCAVDEEGGGRSKVSNVVYIAVFTTLGGVALIAVAAYFLIPKIKLHLQVRKTTQSLDLDTLETVSSRNSLVGGGASPPTAAPTFERAQDMEVTTAAGRFVVRM